MEAGRIIRFQGQSHQGFCDVGGVVAEDSRYSERDRSRMEARPHKVLCGLEWLCGVDEFVDCFKEENKTRLDKLLRPNSELSCALQKHFLLKYEELGLLCSRPHKCSSIIPTVVHPNPFSSSNNYPVTFAGQKPRFFSLISQSTEVLLLISYSVDFPSLISLTLLRPCFNLNLKPTWSSLNIFLVSTFHPWSEIQKTKSAPIRSHKRPHSKIRYRRRTATVMGKQKQQAISRFFAPKPKPSSYPTSTSPPSSPPPSQSPLPNSSTPPPKISATVTYSPLKRLRTSQLISPIKKPSKTPRLSPNPDLAESSRTKQSPPSENPKPSLSNPTLHEKFLSKLLEPSEEDTANVLTADAKAPLNPKYTPLEQQVVELKAKYKDVLLMIEVGYKFRFFGEDAENAARVLGIYAHMDHNFLTASIPTYRLNVHVRRLVSAGYKVGVVKQTETATIKAHGSNKMGPFCRGLSALYTKATLEASEDVGGGGEEGCGSCNNYLVTVVENVNVGDDKGNNETGVDVKIGIVAVEISTGDVIFGEFDDNLLRTGLEAKILSLSPAELLLVDPLSKLTEKFLLAYAGPASNVRVERASRDRYTNGGALAEVLSSFDKIGDSLLNDTQKEKTKCHHATEAIMGMPDLTVQALALTIDHLKQFGF
ncbi:unnamed protein product [Lactuca saligna]|uniref:DNA mismatch repair protein MSH3 n=1 Tax=Lactuca saligna TaxID=75948 RepID=A0AA36EGX4_LACSI|nr:unnamed protein product [Lactuca saligna]